MLFSSSRQLLCAATIATWSLSRVQAQTYSTCNPLTSGSCPPDPALGKSETFDFTKGASDQFTNQGTPTYDGNGVSFTVAKKGDSPQIISKFFLMFGKVDVTMKAAPGTGIVSSAVLQSDVLDEIDWEWLGGDNSQVQSNYFGKGQTGSYNRGAFHPDAGNHDGFKTYSIDWTASQITWSINGAPVRSLTPDQAAGQYPQTPMQLKFGAWAGGDPSNPPGTIQWAGGQSTYDQPYSMVVKSVTATDYSTGTQYTYNGQDGTWQSINAVGGKVNSGGSSPAQAAPAPAVTSASNSIPVPFEGTHRDTTTAPNPSIYPWVASPTTLQTTASATTYPGLPSGWTVSNSGKVVPPSSAATPGQQYPGYGSGSDSPVSAAGGVEVSTGFNEQGFPTTFTFAPGASPTAKSFDDQGFLVTAAPGAGQTAAIDQAQKQPKSTTVKVVGNSASAAQVGGLVWAVACWMLGGLVML